MSDETENLTVDIDVPVFLEESANDDDWGDFAPAIKKLETQENAANDDVISPEEPKVNPEKNQALEGLLGSLFTLTESAISTLNGIEFSFDESGKQEVIAAAVPVINKHGGSWLDDFQYLEEFTLVLAVGFLVLGSRQAIVNAKIEKRERENQEANNAEKEAA